MMSRLLSVVLSGVAACMLSAPVAAQQLAALPAADLAHVTPAQADVVRGARAEFDRTQADASTIERAELFGKIGAVYARVRSYPVAEVATANAALLVPLDARWPYLQGVIARYQDKDSAALGFFQRSFELNPQYLPTRIAFAAALIEAGELDRARALVDEYVATHQDEPAPYAVLGDLAMRQERYKDAIAAFNRVVQLDPEATAVYRALASAYAADGNEAAAQRAAQRIGDGLPRLNDHLLQMVLPIVDAPAASNAPAQGANPVLANVHAHMAANRVPAARSALEAALREQPDNIDYLTTLARVELSDGKPDAALRHAQRAVRVDAGNAQAQMMLGLIAEVRGDAAAAQSAYQKAISADTQLVEARYLLANLQMRSGRHALAMEQYRQLVTMHPDAAEYRARLAAAQAANNQCTGALQDINEAMRTQPDDAALMQVFVRLASTCRSSSTVEREMALDHAAQLYRADQSPWIAESLALAYAANGRWLDAVETQEAAVFAIVIRDPEADVGPYREFLTDFNAERVPALPWPRSGSIYQPPVPHPQADAGARPAG